MKKCSKCGKVKPLDEYHNHKLRKDGKHNQCKACVCAKNRSYAKTYRKNRPPKKDNFVDDIIYTSLKCRRCGKGTEYKYLHKDDFDKMKDKFYCNECKSMIDDDTIYDGFMVQNKYDDIKASELPLMDSPGTQK